MLILPALSKALHQFESDQALRVRYFWPLVLLSAAFAYLYSLGGEYIPVSPDESLYLQITRQTIESDQWLPLLGPEYWRNAKPPLFFWQAMVSTSWGSHWNLLNIRLPIVFYAFMTTAVVFILTRRLGGGKEAAYIAAASFLSFSSSFLHGRPFMTNMPETFFVFLSFSVLLIFKKQFLEGNLRGWILIGLLIGLVTLYRSVMMVVPVGITLSLVLLQARQWNIKKLLQRDAVGLLLFALIAFGVFLLWPLADPNPEAILQKFLVQENLDKITGHGGYFSSLFSGHYPVTRVWFGHLANAGFMVFVLIALVILTIRQRKQLKSYETSLWLIVLAYIFVFSFPSQRQENYLLPTVPALAVLLGLRWKELKLGSFRLFLLPSLIVFPLLGLLMFALDTTQAVNLDYASWHYVVMIGGFALTLFAMIRVRSAPYLLHVSIFLAYIALGSVYSPFEHGAGRYNAKTIKSVQGHTVYVPHQPGSKYRHERHHFILPGARMQSFPEEDVAQRERLLADGNIVIDNLALGATAPALHSVLGSRLVVRWRVPASDVRDILLHHEIDKLVMREVLLVRNGVAEVKGGGSLLPPGED